jgi:DNA-binding transcriptional LysR family regulator
MLKGIDLSRVDLNLLALFEVVLDELHVRRAAERLNLSASAVSHGLGRLRRLLNDPLFLRTPKGVVPTARATELAGPILDILARVRNVVATAEPFDPARSTRRFIIGAPDGVSAVFLPPLLARLGNEAPGIDIGARQLLPPQGGRQIESAWDPVLAELENRAMDIAVVPLDVIPARFAECVLYEEEFVIAARARHPFAAKPSLERYCEMPHLLVSLTGDPYGFVDQALAKHGAIRRVAIAVPNFMMALALIAETDLITALPRKFLAIYAKRFGVIAVEAPFPLPKFRIRAVAPRVALMDAGLAWLFESLSCSTSSLRRRVRGRPPSPAGQRRLRPAP